MRLLHITATHLKPDGGVPVVLKELADAQNEIDDFEVKVISVVAPVDEMNSKTFEYVPKKSFSRYVLEFDPDFAILHSFFYVDYNWVVNELFNKNVRFFIEPHGSFGKEAMKKSHMKKIVANSTIFRKQLERSSGYIFLNRAEYEDSVYHKKYDMIIPNGVKCVQNKKLKNNCEDVTIYFIGRYDINHKGLDFLFDALDLLEMEKYRCSFAFWGKGNAKANEYIETRIKKYKYVLVSKKDSIYGEKKDLQLEQLGPMILTSRYEGFPMTILEAWTYGNPCIVTPGTNVSDEIVENELGWVTEMTAIDISICIKTAIEQYGKYRQEYIKRTKEYVEKKYSWKKIARKSYDLLSKII